MTTMLAVRHVHSNPCPKLPSCSTTTTTTVGVMASSSSEGKPFASPPYTVGQIKRQLLSPAGRTKLNRRPDRDFYSFPRFVKHVDDDFIATLTELYRERLRPDSEVLDLMSSWVSHLPPEVSYKRVVGHGMNALELSRNPRLDYYFVKDLNEDQVLEMKGSSLDAVVCAASVQYMQWPERVFSEVLRVLRPGGVFVVSFSNRMFYEKAVAAWRDGTPADRTRMVVEFFRCVEGFTEAEVVRKTTTTAASSGKEGGGSVLDGFRRLLGFAGSSDPFFAVLAYRNFKPIL